MTFLSVIVFVALLVIVFAALDLIIRSAFYWHDKPFRSYDD